MIHQMQPEHEELKDRLNTCHRLLVQSEQEKYEWRQSKIIFEHVYMTMRAIQKSMQVLDFIQLILNELKLPSCDLLYILQVSSIKIFFYRH